MKISAAARGRFCHPGAGHHRPRWLAYVRSAELSGLTTALFRHPFAVTNALADANADIIAMHRSMKDVAMAQTPADIDRAVADVDRREKAVLEHFGVVRERFLGNKADLDAAAKAFAAWKPMRDEVIRLTREGRKDEAGAITRTKGAAQLAQIERTARAHVDLRPPEGQGLHGSRAGDRAPRRHRTDRRHPRR